MGAGQSSQEASSTTIKTSYYILLGVERDATDDEIKRAYRRKALELHPDRNYGKEEEATRLFADIQAAYEVLSDPQERAWYDSHEGAILRGFEDGDDGADNTAYSYGDFKITTSDDVSRFVAGFAMKRVDYNNVPDKFFTELNEFFARLAEEESRASRMEGFSDPELPTFGVKDDSYEDVVKAFYAGWNGFSTNKSYFWADKWNLTEAPDRRYRRAMEKENKKEREDAIREFNDSVRTLIGFVRKRDPRYAPNFQSDTDRQKALRDAAQAQAAKSRKANAEKMAAADDAVPEWAKARAPDDEEGDFESEEEVIEEIECVACRKSFRSEKQFQAHEKSKKHQKAVQSVKRQMQKDNDMLDLLEERELDDVASEPLSEADTELAVSVSSPSESMEVNIVAEEIDDVKIEDTGDSAANERDANESVGVEKIDTLASSPALANLSSDAQQPPTKQDSTASRLGKAAQKRAKKAAKAASADVDVLFTCVQCKSSFATRSRLFQHIKDFGHAAPQSAIQTGKKKKGKR